MMGIDRWPYDKAERDVGWEGARNTWGGRWGTRVMKPPVCMMGGVAHLLKSLFEVCRHVCSRLAANFVDMHIESLP